LNGSRERALGKETKEALNAGFINPRSSGAIGIPRGCITLAMGYNPACCVVHPSKLACDHVPASDVLIDGSEVCNGSNRRGHGDDARLCLLAGRDALSPQSWW
jgi:hypothetical protein